MVLANAFHSRTTMAGIRVAIDRLAVQSSYYFVRLRHLLLATPLDDAYHSGVEDVAAVDLGAAGLHKLNIISQSEFAESKNLLRQACFRVD